MTFAPGSVPWLLRHELRMTWRTVADAWSRGRSLAKIRWRLIAVAVFLHLCAAPVAFAIVLSPVRGTGLDVVICTCAILVVFSLMLSQALHGVVQALYMRGDFDLVLSSPLPASRILTVRAIAVALNAASAWALIALPLVDMLAVFGAWRWLAAYPVLFALALLATVAGLGLAMTLFALVGARRTRTVAQVMAVLIGAAAFIVSQTQAFLPDGGRKALWAWLASLADADRLGAGSPLWLPAKALFGEPAALASIVGAAMIAFTATVWVLGRAFAANATAVAGTATLPRVGAPVRRKARPFRSGLRTTLLLKEWRLLWRDPWLISQILMQILYLLPLCFLYWRESWGQHVAVASVAMAAVVVAGHLAGGLGWITIAAEDASEMLIAAPVAAREVLRAKLVAALAPVAAIVVLPLIAISVQSPAAGAVAAAGCCAAAVSATLLCLWHQKPGKRRAFAARRKGSTLVNLAEFALNFLWGVATATAIGLSSWALAFAAMALLLLLGLAAIRPSGALLAGI